MPGLEMNNRERDPANRLGSQQGEVYGPVSADLINYRI